MQVKPRKATTVDGERKMVSAPRVSLSPGLR